MKLLVEFSESLDSLDCCRMQPLSWLSLFQGIRIRLSRLSPGFSTVSLLFSQEFRRRTRSYRTDRQPGLEELHRERIASCCLNQSLPCPRPVEPFDIIINEVLFNPHG
ncbi:MAG: hypothetical protein MZV49_05045 [Rhodopseudomonas palustris]|nr:hypothetical protein [Rhodopseudomonas palustris]